ncbi:MAG: DUF2330 domain-containing protein [Burkholderiales bacterium]|nr:DUF2330 domain-containing protein [Anaerolineae bacterium]
MARYRWSIFSCLALLTLVIVPGVLACGGLFCQNVPVDQQAERIIFTINDDSTITAYVQINYVGSAPDFSWVVPVPSVPVVDVAEIATFDELSNLTAPVFFTPLMPACAPIPVPMMAAAESDSAAGGSVQVLASGTAGPYAYDVVTSPDPNELILWLRDNGYRITEQMEPLVRVYTDEGLIFLAMKLQPEQGVQDIQPIVMTYESTHPMIPIRLTAVAATPNMSILTWIFGDGQAVPENFAHPTIRDEDIRGTFSSFDGTNYLALVDQTIDLYQGRAFITEYAQPTHVLLDQPLSDPLVQELATKHPYVTRVFGRMSPEEMTVDPTFIIDTSRADVSNVRDLSGMKPEVFWGCENIAPRIEYDADVVPAGF